MRYKVKKMKVRKSTKTVANKHIVIKSVRDKMRGIEARRKGFNESVC
jgi:hypothetical protein